jgi:glycosyltransferase involved in cell wall biosynthesis
VNQMRLLSLIHHPWFSGPHNHDMRLNSLLARGGVETTVLLPAEPGDALSRLRAADIPVVTYPSHRPRTRVPRTVAHMLYLATLIRKVRCVRRIIRDRNIDLVQLADPYHPHGAIAARLERRPVVVHVIGAGGSLPARAMATLFTCRLARVIMTTGTAIQTAYPGLSRLRSRVVSYFPPVDVSTFKPDVARRHAARAEFGIRPKEVVIGCIARLHPEKDFYTFVRAVSRLRRQFPFVRFVILGAVAAGCASYVSSIWRMAAELGLQPNRDIIHRDANASVADLAQAFDIYWSTGLWEGATTSIGEAMALGMPVVCTDSGSLSEMVEEEVTGFLVGVKQFEDLARVTIPLVENEVFRKRVGDSARIRAVRLFSAESCAAKHLEAYDVALSCFRPGSDVQARRDGLVPEPRPSENASP